MDDLDLNFADFIARVNSDLVGKFVNIASRCAGFIEKRFDGQLADALPDPAMYAHFIAATGADRGSLRAQRGRGRLRLTMALADEANKYIDEHKPWVLAKRTAAMRSAGRVYPGPEPVPQPDDLASPVLPEVAARARRSWATSVVLDRRRRAAARAGTSTPSSRC